MMDFSNDNSFFYENFGLADASSEMPPSLKRKESFDMVPVAKRAAITESLNLNNSVDDVETFAHTVPEPFAPFSMSCADEDIILSDAEIEAALSEVSSTFSGDDGDEDDVSSDDNDSLYEFDDVEEYKETTTKSGRVVMSKVVAPRAVSGKTTFKKAKTSSKASRKASKASKSKAASKKRGNYLCSKCGLPKKGHICDSEVRVRRRSSASGSTPRMTHRQRQAVRLGRNTKTIATAAPVASAPAPPATKAAPLTRPVPVKMVSTGTQCEIGDSALRSLYVDSQGFPESYSNGIFADPTFCVESAPKIVVSGPPPKNYVPPKTTSSCGSGPDSHVLKAAPFSVPFTAVPAPAPLLENPFLGTTLGAPGCSAPGTASDQFAAMQQLAVLMSTFQHSQGLIQGLGAGDATTPPFDPNLLASLFLPVSNTAAPQMPVFRSTEGSLSSSPESIPSALTTAMNEQ